MALRCRATPCHASGQLGVWQGQHLQRTLVSLQTCMLLTAQAAPTLVENALRVHAKRLFALAAHDQEEGLWRHACPCRSLTFLSRIIRHE